MWARGLLQVDLSLGGMTLSAQPGRGQDAARRWIADPLSLMWLLTLAALALPVLGGWQAGDVKAVVAAALAAAIAGVALSGST